MFARRLASFTVTVPTTEVRPSGSFVPKNGILTAPFTPAGPWWMCPSVGAAMPVQVKAYDTWLPWMRTREVPVPSLSPPAGCILLGTSLLPRITVPKNIASLLFLASYLPIESVGIAMFIGIGIGIGGDAVVPPFGVAGAAAGWAASASPWVPTNTKPTIAIPAAAAPSTRRPMMRVIPSSRPRAVALLKLALCFSHGRDPVAWSTGALRQASCRSGSTRTAPRTCSSEVPQHEARGTAYLGTTFSLPTSEILDAAPNGVQWASSPPTPDVFSLQLLD